MTDSEHIRTLHIQGAQWLYIDAQNGTASRFTAWHGGLDAVQQSRAVRLDDKNVVLESAKNSSVKQSAAPSISALLAQLTALHALDAHSVVFGTRAGQLVLLHLATSKKGRHRAVVLSGQHSSAVTWISHVASTLYSGDEHGGVSESHVTADQLRAGRTLIAADTASRASVTLVSALHGAAQLAVVRGRKLKVWDTKSNNYQSSPHTGNNTWWTCASPPVTDLAVHGEWLCVAAKQRHVQLLHLRNNVVLTMTLDAEVTAIDVNTHTEQQQLHVLGVSERGQVSLWATTPTKTAQLAKPDVVIRVLDQQRKPLKVLAARFISADALHLVTGTAATPEFHRVSYVNDKSRALLREITVTAGEEKTVQSHDDESHVPASVVSAQESGSRAHMLSGMHRAVEDDEDSAPAIENSFAEQLAQQQLNSKKKTAPSAAPRVDSILSWLEQVLATPQQQQAGELHRIIASVHDARIIRDTINRLPLAHVLPLLRLLVHSLHSRPALFGSALVEWIRAVLLQRSAYLMTVPGLVDELSGLYALIEARLQHFNGFLSLHGRLQLVTSLINTKRHGSDYSAGEYEPIAVFHEDEDEDEEDEEDEEGSNDVDESDQDSEIEGAQDNDEDLEMYDDDE
jgi:hypothetical protein